MKIYTFTQKYSGTDITDFTVKFVTDYPGDTPADDNITPKKEDFEGLSIQGTEAFYQAINAGDYEVEEVKSVDFDDYIDSDMLKANYAA